MLQKLVDEKFSGVCLTETQWSTVMLKGISAWQMDFNTKHRATQQVWLPQEDLITVIIHISWHEGRGLCSALGCIC
jgi:hypothetical protein